jgi:hypothetical protein
MVQCRHCRKFRQIRAHTLCYRCYHQPDVRNAYGVFFASDTKDQAPTPQPTEPTQEAPGTEGKFLVMIERARRKMSLFHPLDARTNVS